MSICRNAEGVHGQRKFGNTCLKVESDPTQNQLFYDGYEGAEIFKPNSQTKLRQIIVRRKLRRFL